MVSVDIFRKEFVVVWSVGVVMVEWCREEYFQGVDFFACHEEGVVSLFDYIFIGVRFIQEVRVDDVGAIEQQGVVIGYMYSGVGIVFYGGY